MSSLYLLHYSQTTLNKIKACNKFVVMPYYIDGRMHSNAWQHWLNENICKKNNAIPLALPLNLCNFGFSSRSLTSLDALSCVGSFYPPLVRCALCFGCFRASRTLQAGRVCRKQHQRIRQHSTSSAAQLYSIGGIDVSERERENKKSSKAKEINIYMYRVCVENNTKYISIAAIF